MKSLIDFNINLIGEPHHRFVNEALRILDNLNGSHFDGALDFKNELGLSFNKMEPDVEARYNHKKRVIEINEDLSLSRLEYTFHHELGHYYDQKLNDLIFKGKSLYFHGCFASDKIENIINYQHPNNSWTPWQQLYAEREKAEYASEAKLARIYDLLDILEKVSEEFISTVSLNSWKEKGFHSLEFLSRWVKGVKKFNVDVITAREGWEKWKMSTLSSFSFIPATENDRRQELEFWRYSWEQWLQSVEDLLFPSVLDKDYLEWHTTWRSLVKALANNGLTYETKESELWANGLANFLSSGYNRSKSNFFNLLPAGEDKARHDRFWKEMMVFIAKSL